METPVKAMTEPLQKLCPQDERRLSTLGKPIITTPIKRFSRRRQLEFLFVWVAAAAFCLFCLTVVAPLIHHVLFWFYNMLTGNKVIA